MSEDKAPNNPAWNPGQHTEHTPEPWRVDDQRTFTQIVTNNMDICGVWATGTKDQNKANAARIVACVNSLAGIEDPASWRKNVDHLVKSDVLLNAVNTRIDRDRTILIDALEQLITACEPHLQSKFDGAIAGIILTNAITHARDVLRITKDLLFIDDAQTT